MGDVLVSAEVAADMLGRLERAGAALADVLVLSPQAVADLTTTRAWHRFARWRAISPATHELLDQVMWFTGSAVPDARMRLAILQARWSRPDGARWTATNPLRLVVAAPDG